MLGTIALSGMIMRNPVILVDQIRQDMEEGARPGMPKQTDRAPLPPIMLTAAAAILAMIPLTRSASSGRWRVAIARG